MEIEELRRVRALNTLFFVITIASFVLIIKFCSPGPYWICPRQAVVPVCV